MMAYKTNANEFMLQELKQQAYNFEVFGTMQIIDTGIAAFMSVLLILNTAICTSYFREMTNGQNVG